MTERLPRPAARAEFRARLREQLLREAPAALVPAPRRRAVWWRPLAAATAATVLTLAVALAADTAAAESLPGEAPFAIKRSAEEVRLFAARDRATRVQAVGAQVEGRLSELRRAIAQRRPAVAAEAARRLAVTLERLGTEIAGARADLARSRNAEQAGAIRRIERLASRQVIAIEALLPSAPVTAEASLERAIEQARRIAPARP